MKEENQVCARCGWLDRYFTVEEKRLREAKYGWCRNNRGIVQTCSTCSGFVPKKTRPRRTRMLECSLSNLLKELSEIRMIMEQEEREREDV